MSKNIRGLAQPYVKSLAEANVGADRAYQILRRELGPGYSRDLVRQDINSYRTAEQKAKFSEFYPPNSRIPLKEHELFKGQSMKYRFQYEVTLQRHDLSGKDLPVSYMQIGFDERPRKREIDDAVSAFAENDEAKYEPAIVHNYTIKANWIRQDAYNQYGT